MSEAASRDLRNSTRSLLERARAGETITITVGGRAVAQLGPLSRRPTWLPRHQFTRELLGHQADPALDIDLRQLAPDTTDDL